MKNEFFIANPRPYCQCLIKVKDYNFTDNWRARSKQETDLKTPTDFDYPLEKPSKTFRILMVGESPNGFRGHTRTHRSFRSGGGPA